MNFVGAENVTYSKYDLQIGLFHGARPLCPERTISLKNGDTDVEFDITVSNVPRMAKLCFGLFERKKNNPASWVNANVFDYKVNKTENAIFTPMLPAQHIRQNKILLLSNATAKQC